MRKSEEFDNVLDECLERLLARGETIEQCLQSFPKHADELKPLLETALATKQVSAIQPRSEFMDKARYQLYSVLQETERVRSRSFFSWVWQPRWATVVAIILALFLAGGGTMAAASDSMPDEPLYPVKLATEQVQLIFTPSALGKAELYAKLAEKRVTEIVRMADKNKPEQIERTAQRLDAYLTEIAVLSSPQELRVAMAPSVPQLPPDEQAPPAPQPPVVIPAPPAEEAPSLAAAESSEKASVEVDPRAQLRETVANQAESNTARLRALLETVPESARPALLQAIATSEAGYEKALESLE